MNQEVTHLQVLAELERLVLDKEFVKDIANKNPTDKNLAKFILSWNGLILDKKVIGKLALKKLTWTNLGYRMAKRFGKQSEEEMRYVFRVIKEDFKRRK